MPDLGDLLRLGGALAVMALIYWVLNGGPWKRRRAKVVADEPEGMPYHVYTREHDRVVAAREVPALMTAADGDLLPTDGLNVTTWPERLAAVERLADNPVFSEAAATLDPVLGGASGDLAVMLLIDQSGSMQDNILSVAASVRWLSGLCDAHRVPLAVAGFTSLGWRGGAVRRQWQAAGRPKRPGRLCALLHIRYVDFDGPLDDEDWRAMAHPQALRENIDGEAIEWAAGDLAARPERRKLLIVLSDGAPVDDSTIMQNGEKFLVRHIRHVIAETEAAGVVRLGAVGIEHRVGEYYSSSTEAIDLARLPLALAAQIVDLASDAKTDPA